MVGAEKREKNPKKPKKTWKIQLTFPFGYDIIYKLSREWHPKTEQIIQADKIFQKSLKKQLTKRFVYGIMDRLSREGTERSSVKRRLKIE